MGVVSLALNRRAKIWFLVLDIVAFIACFSLVFGLREQRPLYEIAFVKSFWMTLLISHMGLYIYGAYDLEGDVPLWKLLPRVFLALLSVVAFIIFYNYLFVKDRSGFFGRGVLLGSLLFYGFVIASIRIWVVQGNRRSRDGVRWLFLVSDLQSQEIQKLWKEHAHLGVGQYITHFFGEGSGLFEKIKESWSAVVVGASPQDFPANMSEVLMKSRMKGLLVLDLMSFYEKVFRRVPVGLVSSHWFMVSSGFNLLQNRIGLRMKRIVDIGLSLLLFVITAPVWLLTAIAIKLESKGPVFYKQTRTGMNGKDFAIYKFRSMGQDAEKNGAQWAVKKDPRVTTVGNFIRKTRIDELPQVINVLRGDMSFIGPRPERPEFNQKLEEQIPFYELRHLVRPGITGWAQVLYPYGASVEDAKSKLEYDLYYIKNYSLFLDVMILMKTIAVVVLGRGR